jgi:ribonuclease PH
LDLCFEEDSRAGVDMNFVMTGSNKMVEVQATAEHQVFDDSQLQAMVRLARKGAQELLAKQQEILKSLLQSPVR